MKHQLHLAWQVAVSALLLIPVVWKIRIYSVDHYRWVQLGDKRIGSWSWRKAKADICDTAKKMSPNIAAYIQQEKGWAFHYGFGNGSKIKAVWWLVKPKWFTKEGELS